MTFANHTADSFDAALDIIAPRADTRDADEDSRIAAAYAAGRITPFG